MDGRAQQSDEHAHEWAAHGDCSPLVFGHLSAPVVSSGCKGHFSQGKESGKHDQENQYP